MAICVQVCHCIGGGLGGKLAFELLFASPSAQATPSATATASPIATIFPHTAMTRSNWVAWALNPTGQRMVGAQALVAFFNSTGALHAYTSPIAAYSTGRPFEL
ncbi:hypothetical protein ACS0TY_001496 [Phlomoides rotata]